MSDDDDNIREPTNPRAPIPFAPPAPARRREGRPPAQAQGPQAAAVLDPLRPRRPGHRLDDLRDDDGGRVRPAPDREPSRVQASGRELLPVRRPLAQDRHPRAAQQRGDRHLRPDSDRTCATRSSPSRTSGSGLTRAWTSGASPARSSPTSPAALARAHRRSPSSSSRTPWPQKATARCSRSCARRRWPITSRASGPRPRSSTEYLNSIYFGNGAYGAESAARVYFGKALGYDPSASAASAANTADAGRHTAAGTRRCTPAPRSSTRPQAALLAGMVANPTAFNPLQPETRSAAWSRRDLVLKDMVAHGRHLAHAVPGVPERAAADRDRHRAARGAAGRAVLHQLAADPRSWRAMERGGVSPSVAGLPRLLRWAEDPHHDRSADAAGRAAGDLAGPAQRPGQPAASLVAIDNKTGQVRAMVGGPLVDGQEDFQKYPFNLATEGFRQPGSAFKPFTLAVALAARLRPELGVRLQAAGPDRAQQRRQGALHGQELRQRVLGPDHALRRPPIVSDNSVFTQLGLSPGVGTKRISRMATAMGIRSPVSTNYAMIIGGLKQGVTTLDMAHAYETIATGGLRVYDPGLGAPNEGPTGIAQIQCLDIKCHGKSELYATPHYQPRHSRDARPRSSTSCSRAWSSTAPVRRRRSPASTWPARRAPPPTTATPGSWAGRRRSPPRCGSASRTS